MFLINILYFLLVLINHCQLIRKGVTVEAYASIRNRDPPLCTGLRYEDREKKLLMINITMITSYPSVFRIN